MTTRRGSSDAAVLGTLATLALFFVCAASAVGLWGCPRYRVWQQGQEGAAELARAEANRQVAVTEAHARRDSATMLAEAEVLRAEGVAKANKIIGDSLKGNEAYLRYLWIAGLEHSKGQVIYVPTEANLPILEAGKR